MKTNIIKAFAGYQQALYGLVLLALTGMAGCKKDTPVAQPSGPDNSSTIKYVLNDNFTFSVVYGALTKVSLQDSLANAGPYTFIAPDNGAYLLMNIPALVTPYSFQFFTSGTLKNMMRYYTIDGEIALKKLPLTENKPYKTHTGGNIYISKYLNGTDTVTTVNGLKFTSMDNATSNGFIQVIPQIMNAEVYLNAVSYLHNDSTLTLFSAALQRSGLAASLLQGNEPYTLLAPSNMAFQQSAKLRLNLGVSTLDSILMADPVKLTTFLKSHIIKGRYFDGDFFRYFKADPESIVTLNANKITIGGNPAGFHAITFVSNGNKGIPAAIAAPAAYNPTIINSNIPCGNAVVHIINRVLIP
ncbi:hypothetical protein GCM10023149_07690 [Mucilaginibacter gynuensis]|uniref:FAS1 domain-containing protein n=1 Tax=Mucilaginibacter gynuensis TaxID=1302236 RepID=A0ABP8FWH5_9SPHI